MILKKNDLSPDYGVFVPEDRYRFYKEELAAYKVIKDNPCPECVSGGSDLWKVFLSGLVIGYLGAQIK